MLGLAIMASLALAPLPFAPLPFAPLPFAQPSKAFMGMRYIDNGRVRLGIDLGRGGAITFLSHAGGPNMVNDFDLGRQIQMSYYSGPVPFTPNGKQPAPAWRGLGWNPIQSGDCFGHPSKSVEVRVGAAKLYVKSIPMQWPLDNEPGECAFESWITLDGDAVRVRNRISNHRIDAIQYPGRTQELPAVYTNGPWYRLVTYSGDRPFTNSSTVEIPQRPPGEFLWSSFQATESWVALLDARGDGIGVYAPGVQSFSGGFAGKPGSGGSSDSPTGYIAPNLEEILDSNVRYDNEYTLILGGLTAIRAWVYTHSAKPSPPDYDFRRDRQHWVYANAVDAGWPIRGALRLHMAQNDPQMIGPVFLASTETAPRLYIRAALKTKNSTSEAAQVFWSRFDAPGFSPSRSVTFPIPGDGKERVYEVDLSKSPEYRGVITRLRFDPEPTGHPGDEIVVRSIGFRQPRAVSANGERSADFSPQPGPGL